MFDGLLGGDSDDLDWGAIGQVAAIVADQDRLRAHTMHGVVNPAMERVDESIDRLQWLKPVMIVLIGAIIFLGVSLLAARRGR
jgi:hypothetical protein